jgi:hypothetical protein
MSHGVFWDVTPCGYYKNDVSEELSNSIIRVTRFSELGATLVPPKHRFLQEPHGVTSQKMPFFIVTAVKTLNLTSEMRCTVDLAITE